MPSVGFKPTILVCKRAKTVHAAIVIGILVLGHVNLYGFLGF
jgi:hypothetical protein